MTIRNHPPIQQTLPGRSREYRLYTVADCDYGDFQASTVTVGNWGVSYQSTYGEEGHTLHIYDCVLLRSQSEDYKHPLYGTVYPTQEDANRAAFEAGCLAYMVYEQARPVLA